MPDTTPAARQCSLSQTNTVLLVMNAIIVYDMMSNFPLQRIFTFLSPDRWIVQSFPDHHCTGCRQNNKDSNNIASGTKGQKYN